MTSMLEKLGGTHRILSKYDFVLWFLSCFSDCSSLKGEEYVMSRFISPQSQRKKSCYLVYFCLQSNDRDLGNFENQYSKETPRIQKNGKKRRKLLCNRNGYIGWVPAISQACIDLQVISLNFYKNLDYLNVKMKPSFKCSGVGNLWTRTIRYGWNRLTLLWRWIGGCLMFILWWISRNLLKQKQLDTMINKILIAENQWKDVQIF